MQTDNDAGKRISELPGNKYDGPPGKEAGFRNPRVSVRRKKIVKCPDPLRVGELLDGIVGATDRLRDALGLPPRADSLDSFFADIGEFPDIPPENREESEENGETL